MNIFAKIAPNWVLKRELAKTKLAAIDRAKLYMSGSGYAGAGASTSKRNFLGWKPFSQTADQDITANLPILRNRSRALYVGGGLPRGAINKLVTNVVGSGLMLNSQIDYNYLGISRDEASQIERTIEREFKLWADDKYSCDIGNSVNFYEMQGLAFLSMLMSGDCFVLLPQKLRSGNSYRLKLQLLESDRVTNPINPDITKDILEGIESDTYGAPIAYHIKQRNSPLDHETKFARVEAYTKNGRANVLHLMTRERPEQRRGIPLISGIIEQVKQLTRYADAELDAAVLSAFFTIFIKKSAPEYNAEWTPPTESESEGQADPSGMESPNEKPTDMKLAPGAIHELDEGESIEIANPSRPNQQFDAFTTAIIRQIGVAIEVPYEVLVQHFQSSYSASRAAILQAWQMFYNRRDWLIANFCLPVYKEWMTEAVVFGRLSLPGFLDNPLARQAWLGVNFYGSSMPEIDPVKAVNAATKRIDEGLSTREREAMTLTGMNFDEIVGTRIAEEKNMNEIRQIINKTNLQQGTLANG